MRPFGIDQRLRQLEAHIAKDFAMLNEYRDLLRVESDPRRREKYNMAIAQLQESAVNYQREYGELAADMPDPRAEPNNDLNMVHAKLDALALGIRAVLDGQDDLRRELLAGYDVGQQRLLAELTARLDRSQLETVAAILREVEANRLPEAEMTRLVDCARRSMALLQESGKSLPAQAEIERSFAEQATLKDKLKLALPLIPSILEYEIEMEFDQGASLKEIWQQIKARFRR